MIEEETQQMVIASNEVQPPLDPPTQKAKQENKDLMSMLEDVIKSSGSSTLPPSDSAGKMVEIKKEMNNYLCLELLSVQKILCIGGVIIRDISLTYLSWQGNTSVSRPLLYHQREPLAWHGYIVNEIHSCLLSDNVNTLVFLAANL